MNNFKNIGNKNLKYTKRKIIDDYNITEREYSNVYKLMQKKMKNYSSLYDNSLEGLSINGVVNYYFKQKEGELYNENQLIKNIIKTSSSNKISKTEELRVIKTLSDYQGFDTFSTGFVQLEQAKEMCEKFIKGEKFKLVKLKIVRFGEKLNANGVKLADTRKESYKMKAKLNKCIHRFNKEFEEKVQANDRTGIFEIYRNFIKEFMKEIHTMYEAGYIESGD